MTDAENFDWGTNAAELAVQLEATLEDEKKPGAGDAARIVVQGLRNLIGENDDVDLVALKYAATVTKLMAVLAQEPIQSISETVDNTMVAYALAAGVLSGQYEAPACEHCGTDGPSTIPDTIPEDWGNYL